MEEFDTQNTTVWVDEQVVEQDSENEEEHSPQAFDSSLKDLVEQEAVNILPELVSGVIYKRTLNIELIRPTIRADKAYLVGYSAGKDHILHIEIESGINELMPVRMLVYGSILHLDHHLPVISVIVYLFRGKKEIARPPLRIISGERLWITFDYLTIELYELDAESYVREQKVYMYPLLPTMQNVTDQLIEVAIKALVARYKNDGVALAQRYTWMRLLLNRSDTIKALEKAKIREVMDMYSHLWDTDPDIMKVRADSMAKGRKEGEAIGEIRKLRQVIVRSVEVRFPSLAMEVKNKVDRIVKVEELEQLFDRITTANDENVIRRILYPPVA